MTIRQRLRPSYVVLAIAIATVMAGCGSSKAQKTGTTASTPAQTTSTAAASTVTPSTVEACLQRAGYNVSTGVSNAISNGSALEMNTDLDSGFVSKGSAREPWGYSHQSEKGDLTAVGSSGGQGEATIVMFAHSTGAEEAAAEVQTASEKPEGSGSEATPASEGVKVAWRDNGAWIAWTNGANTSEQIASCFP